MTHPVLSLTVIIKESPIRDQIGTDLATMMLATDLAAFVTRTLYFKIQNMSRRFCHQHLKTVTNITVAAYFHVFFDIGSEIELV